MKGVQSQTLIKAQKIQFAFRVDTWKCRENQEAYFESFFITSYTIYYYCTYIGVARARVVLLHVCIYILWHYAIDGIPLHINYSGWSRPLWSLSTSHINSLRAQCQWLVESPPNKCSGSLVSRSSHAAILLCMSATSSHADPFFKKRSGCASSTSKFERPQLQLQLIIITNPFLYNVPQAYFSTTVISEKNLYTTTCIYMLTFCNYALLIMLER